MADGVVTLAGGAALAGTGAIVVGGAVNVGEGTVVVSERAWPEVFS